MLRLGVFGGAYFADTGISEYPKSWFIASKVSRKFNVRLNCLQVASGQTRQQWIDNGWINPADPLGFFQWYCRYYMGRRIDDDDRQINRWRAFIPRHVGMVRYIAKGDPCKAPTSRQALLQWAMDPYYEHGAYSGQSMVAKINEIRKKCI